nr:unnamed protein product [Digitaria exilis]
MGLPSAAAMVACSPSWKPGGAEAPDSGEGKKRAVNRHRGADGGAARSGRSGRTAAAAASTMAHGTASATCSRASSRRTHSSRHPGWRARSSGEATTAIGTGGARSSRGPPPPP